MEAAETAGKEEGHQGEAETSGGDVAQVAEVEAADPTQKQIGDE